MLFDGVYEVIDKKEKEKNQSIAIPRSLWQELGAVHAWKIDLAALKRNSG